MITSSGSVMLAISSHSQTSLETKCTGILENLRKFSFRDSIISDDSSELKMNYPYRLTGYFDSVNELISFLENDITKYITYLQVDSDIPKLVWIFPGGGVQYSGMGADLYNCFSTFQEAVDECCIILQEFGRIDPRQLYLANRNDLRTTKKFSSPMHSSVCIFVYQYAMTRLLIGLGIEPDILIGNSLGEYAAATTAGVFSLKDVLYILFHRGKLLQSLADPGMMIIVHTSEHYIKKFLNPRLSISSYNSPSSLIVAGSRPDMFKFQEQLKDLEISFKIVKYEAASHCELVAPILNDFCKLFNRLKINMPVIDWFSSMSTLKIINLTTDDYWQQQFSSPVLFFDTIKKNVIGSKYTILEIGPQTGLKGIIKNVFSSQKVVAVSQHEKDERNEVNVIFSALSYLWKNGANIDFNILKSQVRINQTVDTIVTNHSDSYVAREAYLDVELAMLEIWKIHFSSTLLNIKSDFFELGGNSLLATRIASEVSSIFNLHFPASLILSNSTITKTSRALIIHGKQRGVDIIQISSALLEILNLRSNQKDFTSTNAQFEKNEGLI